MIISIPDVPNFLDEVLKAAVKDSSTGPLDLSSIDPGDLPPPLDHWQLAEDIKHLIFNPAPEGSRHQADARVVRALFSAGAAIDDVVRIFLWYSIGTAGKMADPGNGLRYLAQTIKSELDKRNGVLNNDKARSQAMARLMALDNASNPTPADTHIFNHVNGNGSTQEPTPWRAEWLAPDFTGPAVWLNGSIHHVEVAGYAGYEPDSVTKTFRHYFKLKTGGGAPVEEVYLTEEEAIHSKHGYTAEPELICDVPADYQGPAVWKTDKKTQPVVVTGYLGEKQGKAENSKTLLFSIEGSKNGVPGDELSIVDEEGIPFLQLEQWHEEWRNAAATGGGKFYSAAEFMKAYLRSEEEANNDPIPSILPRSEVMVLFGTAGSGKTTTLIDMSVQKACGMALLQAWDCQAGTVLYCATEDLSGVAKHLASAYAQENIRAEDNAVYVHNKLPSLVEPPVFGQKTAGGWDFFLSVRKAQFWHNLPPNVDLLILDYLRNATEGANENSNDDMGLALDAANRIARALNAGVVLGAHTGKLDDETPRGAIVIRDKSYCMARLKGKAEVKSVTPVKLEFTKNPKGAEKPKDIHLQLTHAPNGGVFMMPVAAPTEVTARAAILQALRNEGMPLSNKSLQELTGLSPDTLDTTLRRMVEAGDINRLGSKKPFDYELVKG